MLTGLHEEKAMRLLSPFPLDHARALPVTGELHPLRQEFNRWMSWGNAATMLMAFAGVCGYLSLQRERIAPNVVLTHPPDSLIVIVNPPPIGTGPGKPHLIPLDLFKKFGALVPVQDASPQAVDYTIPEIGSIGNVGPDEIGAGEIGPGDVINVGGSDALPGPDTFVPCEEFPILLHMQTPVYPPLAREAGTEGTVVLRVLVSKEGRVLNSIVLSGNPMLAEAARTAALTALFKPALQQHKPVSVWVQLPIVFSLN